MGKVYELIDDKMQKWMHRQQMFFVGTAPLLQDGHVNISPKGFDSLRVLDGNTLAYFDSGGSGVETIAHLRENGRIVIMMCAFDGPPKIVRFHGSGDVVSPLNEDFADLAGLFGLPGLGARAIVRVNVSRISDSCGYGVPLYSFQAHRESSQNWVRKKGVDGIREYQVEKNMQSIDEISGLTEDEARAYVAPVTPDRR